MNFFKLLLIIPFIHSYENCTNDNYFSKELKLLENSPFNYEYFEKINVNENKCHYIKHAPFSIHQTIENFTCSQDICFRWCSYNPNCAFSYYDPTDKVCIRSTNMELSDNYKESKKYFSSEKV